MKKLYFLGPVGTYSEIAATKIKNILAFDTELTAVSTIAKVVDIVDKDENALGVVPVENSIEGIVRQSIDNIYSSDVKIQSQIDIKVEHCLIAKGNKRDIKHIISHPQALAQCQKYIVSNFDENIELLNTDSTAKAGEFISDKDNSYAAIVSSSLANSSKYNIIDKNIGDIKENKTRFILIAKKDINIGKKERTSIVFNTKNEAGALLKILSIINKYGLNLVYLESRPSKKVFGEYNFFADIDGGIDEIKNTLDEIEKECNFYKLLGSYCILSE